MLSVGLFIFYFIVLLIALNALVIKKQFNVPFPELIAIYAYKVLLGCLYGYIFLKFYKGDDTWAYQKESLIEYQKLIHHPIEFLKDFLPHSGLSLSNNFWPGLQFYIMDLEYWMMLKLLAVFNIFSRGNYYINVLFFDFITVIGLLLLYKLLCSYFPGKKKIFVIVLFFLPLATFWLSGIRAEGLLVLFIAIILNYSSEWFNNQKKIIYLIYIMFAMTGCGIFRSQLLIVFIPAFFCMIISWHKPKRAIFYFSSVYIFLIIIFFSSMLISPQKNLSTPVISRQQEFFRLHGTSYELDSLQPSFKSFIKVLPQAFSNTFLRPYLWEAKGFLQLLTALDIVLFWAVLLFAILFHEKKWKETSQSPLFLLLALFGLSQIIIIGYIVPFPGAIVRYKSIPGLFLLLCLISLTDYNRIFSGFTKKD
jgi:hypothetical protein